MKRWLYRGYEPADADRIQSDHNISRLTAVLLAQRGVTEPAAVDSFLNPSLDQLHDPYRMLGMQRAVERIQEALERGEKVLIYGDYDVDGTTSTALLLKTFELIGGRADFHVPHRVREGYGMRSEVVEQAARDDVKLVISVDTGIREAVVVDRARELGVDTIITDHHLPEDRIPAALAVLNPNQPGCDYPDKNLCGAGVAFKLVQALLAASEIPPGKQRRILESMLKMVAVATVADMVPLLGENRVFVSLGLEGLRRPNNIGLKALLDVAGLANGRAPSAGDVGFRIGPRLNAAGRMDTARDVIELFTTADPARASAIAVHLDRLNSERQQAENDVLEEILERLGSAPPPDVLPFLVLEGRGWHPGVVGIVASRVIERFHRPTLVLSVNEETGLATGSGRSISNFHILEALESCAPIFERFGGHKQAVGCTLQADRVPELRRLLNDHAAEVLGPEDFIPELRLDAELELSRINDDLMAEIARLGPHGLGNPTPVFATPGAVLEDPPRLLKDRHLKLRISRDGALFTAMGWRMGQRFNELDRGARLDAAYTIDRDDYWGGWQLVLKDFKPA